MLDARIITKHIFQLRIILCPVEPMNILYLIYGIINYIIISIKQYICYF